MGITKHANKIKKILPSWAYKICSQMFIRRKFPRHIFIETTSRCNLNCSYCPRPSGGTDMRFEMFKGIVDEATRYGACSFSLHLFGEPLLWPYIIDGIKYIKRRNRSHTILLTTNGTRLKAFKGKLQEVGRIIWTYRPNVEIPEEFKKKTVVRIIEGETPEEGQERYKSWKKEIRRKHNYGGEISLSSNVQNVEKRWACYHLWFAPAVDANGNILLCCADPKKRMKLGKFPDVSISQAWQSQKLKALRREQRKGNFMSTCKNCDVWKEFPNIWF